MVCLSTITGACGILTLEEKYSISSDQLDCEIEEKDMIHLASCFDNVEYYISVLGLTPSEQNDVRKKAQGDGNQLAIKDCLSLWRLHDPFRATLRNLLEILLKLKKEEVASNVCNYYCPKSKF